MVRTGNPKKIPKLKKKNPQTISYPIYIVWLLKLPTSGWSILCPTNFLVLEMSQQIFLSIHQLRVTACPWQSCNRWLFHNTKRLWSKRPPVSSGWWL
jgi:hypothetical protein